MAFNDRKNHYLHFCLILYDLSGLRISSKPYLKILSLYMLYPLMIIYLGMIMYDFRYKYTNVFEIADVFTSMCIIISLGFRKTILIRYRSLFEEIIKTHSKFWPYKLFGKPTEARLRNYMQLCVYLIKIFLLCGISSIVTRCVSPIFVKDILLPQDCWIPGNSHFAKNVIYIFEIIFYIESITYFPLFDGLYIVITGNIKSQFILLQKALESLNLKEEKEEISWAKLKNITEHHKLVLSVLDKINKIYSFFFLCTYLLTITLTCIPFFVILDKSSGLAQIIESILVTLVMNVLLIMMCIPGSELEIEAENLVTQIYNVNWYETGSLRIRKFILFFLMEAQTPVRITGGGMLIINRALILHVQRIAYSISTLLAGMAS